MTFRRYFLPILTATLFFFFFAGALRADESAVRLEAPASAAPGTEITVRVVVTHEGNNYFHFTDWVWIQANGQEIGRWNFTADHRPEDENFVRDVAFTIDGPTTFRAQANCNLHGSAGPAEVTVAATAGPAAGEIEKGADGDFVPAAPDGRRGLAMAVLVLGIANLLLAGFQVATGRRWIRVKIAVHRRTGQLLLLLALIHGVLAILVS